MDPRAADYRELLARIFAGRLFRRASRQRELLEYLCREAFAVPYREVHEQSLGVAVFGRSPDYDTSQDNIVRVHVSELRKKLEEYFKTEGAEEPFTLEIPRGGYTPMLKGRTTPASVPERTALAVSPPLADPAPATARARTSMANRWLLAAVAALTVLSLYLGARNVQLRRAASPAVAASPLWRQFFAANRETDLIVADSCISLLTDIVDHPVTLQEYLDRSYMLGTIAPEHNAERRRDLELLMTRRYTSMADVLTVQRVTNLGALDRKSVSLYFARDYPSQRLRSMGTILVGSKRSNPWVEAFESRMSFRMDYDPVTHNNLVRNLRPTPTEPASYSVPGGVNDPKESLAIIAYLPSAQGTAEAIILSGTGVQGTTAAGEAFVSSGQWPKLRRALPQSSSGRIPYFEALLKTDAVGATVQSFELISLHLVQ
jgi:hypothetical protein